MKKVVFVCTGNTCRSPMAMALFNDIMKKNSNSNFVADSAGLAAMGDEINPNSVKALSKIGIDFNGYRSKALTTDMLYDACLIVVMTLEQKVFLESMVKKSTKIVLLGDGIPDPYGGDEKEYEDCFVKIKEGIEALFNGGYFK